MRFEKSLGRVHKHLVAKGITLKVDIVIGPDVFLHCLCGSVGLIAVYWVSTDYLLIENAITQEPWICMKLESNCNLIAEEEKHNCQTHTLSCFFLSCFFGCWFFFLDSTNEFALA